MSLGHCQERSRKTCGGRDQPHDAAGPAPLDKNAQGVW